MRYTGDGLISQKPFTGSLCSGSYEWSHHKPEEGLLGSEDLHGGCGVLGKVGQAAGMGNEAGADLRG